MMNFQKIEIAYEVEKLRAELETNLADCNDVVIAVADAIKHRCTSVTVNKKKINFINKELFFEQLFKQSNYKILFSFVQIFNELNIAFIRSNPVLYNICKQNKELNDYIISIIFTVQCNLALTKGTSLQDIYNQLISRSIPYSAYTYYGMDIGVINNWLTIFKNVIDFPALCDPNNIRAKVFWTYFQNLINSSYKTFDFNSINKTNSFFRYFNECSHEIDWNSFSLLWNKKWIRFFIYKKVGQNKVNYIIPETEFRRFIENWKKFI